MQSSPIPGMKLLSWNVNGLRAALKKGFAEFLAKEKPDIMCVQESRVLPEEIDHRWAAGYNMLWHPAEKKGYAGTLILAKRSPSSVRRGMGGRSADIEGRVLAAEFESFWLVNVYVPNSQRDLARLDYRQEWDARLRRYLRSLENKKPVVVCGDFNVAHTELDLARPKENTRTHGFTIEERKGFEALVRDGFIDSFREFKKSGGHYTWWSTMNNARQRNIGWRIDYFLVSRQLRSDLKRAWIMPDVTGSDHCPVGLELGAD
jgi:exodeoxyribonuclease-3